MSILILCIYNNTPRNIKLLEIQRQNAVKHNLIDYYFITYDDNMNEEYKLANDTLFIKGKETNMNILDKTIKSLHLFINMKVKKYDFIVRTNISTAFNYNLLYKYVSELPKNNVYIGGILFKLDWIDECYGITKQNIKKYSLKHLYYFQGTCIILSLDVVTFMLDNANKLIHDVVDDVALGLFVKTYLPKAYAYMELIKSINFPKCSKLYSIKETSILKTDSVFYRHNSFNDDEDITNMINTFTQIHSSQC